MRADLRVVVDTNVVVSAALLPQSVSRKGFDLATQAGQILLSEETFAELHEVLHRPHLNKYLTDEMRLQFLHAYVREAKLVLITQAISECRDPKDNAFLELAVSGAASHLISGDRDLLVMHPFRGIEIVSPSTFCQLLEEQQ